MTSLYLIVPLALFLQTAVNSAPSQQSINILESHAEAGDAKAEVQLGIIYASGNGVPANEVMAVQWFRKAAESGDAAGEYSLGEMYLSGRGVSQDTVEAVKWIRLSAERGDARGQFNLAVFCLQTADFPEAATWMRKAADQGLAAGQFGLGEMYQDGKGFPANQSEAIGWYRKAAAQGDVDALNNLAVILATSADKTVSNPAEAVTIAQELVNADGRNPAYLDTLATAYYAAGNVVEAAKAERLALTLKPNDAGYLKALKTYTESNRIKP